jgi:hypothetical protein
MLSHRNQISSYFVFFPNLAFCTTDEIAEKKYYKEDLPDPLQNSPIANIIQLLHLFLQSSGWLAHLLFLCRQISIILVEFRGRSFNSATPFPSTFISEKWN